MCDTFPHLKLFLTKFDQSYDISINLHKMIASDLFYLGFMCRAFFEPNQAYNF